MPPYSKEIELGSSNQEASQSESKNTGVVLVPCHTWKCPYSYFQWCGYFHIPGSHLLQQISSQWRSKKLPWGLVSHELTAYLPVSYLFLTQWIVAILSKGCKLDNFQSYNSLKLSFTKICHLRSNLLNVNLPLNQTLLTFWLYVRKTWMTQMILAISLRQVIFL